MEVCVGGGRGRSRLCVEVCAGGGRGRCWLCVEVCAGGGRGRSRLCVEVCAGGGRGRSRLCVEVCAGGGRGRSWLCVEVCAGGGRGRSRLCVEVCAGGGRGRSRLYVEVCTGGGRALSHSATGTIYMHSALSSPFLVMILTRVFGTSGLMSRRRITFIRMIVYLLLECTLCRDGLQNQEMEGGSGREGQRGGKVSYCLCITITLPAS